MNPHSKPLGSSGSVCFCGSNELCVESQNCMWQSQDLTPGYLRKASLLHSRSLLPAPTTFFLPIWRALQEPLPLQKQGSTSPAQHLQRQGQGWHSQPAFAGCQFSLLGNCVLIRLLFYWPLIKHLEWILKSACEGKLSHCHHYAREFQNASVGLSIVSCLYPYCSATLTMIHLSEGFFFSPVWDLC